jgi:hypothetical protein
MVTAIVMVMEQEALPTGQLLMVAAIVMVMEQEALPTGQLLMVTTIVMVMEQDSRNVNESLGLFFAQRKCRFELNFLNLFL